jgi:hypothetical protein
MNSSDTVSVSVSVSNRSSLDGSGSNDLKQKVDKKKIPIGLLREFQEKHRKIYILTTRYNNTTLMANRSFLEKSRGKYKCVYSSPSEISDKIPSGAKCVVLEMNNDTNRIIGIGLIEKMECKKKLWIQEWGNYNRVHYTGYFRMDRSELDLSGDLREKKIMELLDLLCFKGSGHLKRGKGLTMFPVSYLYSFFEKGVDIELEIREMFNRRFS